MEKQRLSKDIRKYYEEMEIRDIPKKEIINELKRFANISEVSESEMEYLNEVIRSLKKRINNKEV